MKQFFITTAIDYANGSPHLGHAYEKVLADVIARTQRLRGAPVHFLTGLDEHGQKVQQSAKKRGIDPQQLCDEVATEFKGLLDKLNISNDDYIRTTEQRHKGVVRTILQKLFDEGHIYESEYRGFYSTRQEQFLLEKDKIDGKWPEIYGEVSEVVEKNYFFKLARHQTWLKNFLKDNPDWIFPAFRQKQVVEFLENSELNDLCISRPRERLEWGIPLPFDEKYVTYVWFDALVNYVSAIGYGTSGFAEKWPADVHVIGKDIIIPPHAIYWPIMLHALGLEPPRKLLAHGWWLVGGKKQSKSEIEKAKELGSWDYDPLDLAKMYGADAFRYFLMREMTVGQDSEFTDEQFIARYNSELADDFGNLVSRMLNMVTRYANGTVPHCDAVSSDIQNTCSEWRSVCGIIERIGNGVSGSINLMNYEYSYLLLKINEFVKFLNKQLEETMPWKHLKKQGATSTEREKTKALSSLAIVAEGIRLSATAYAPVMPQISDKVLGLFGLKPVNAQINENNNSWSNQLTWDFRVSGMILKEQKAILFPKLDLNEKAKV